MIRVRYLSLSLLAMLCLFGLACGSEDPTPVGVSSSQPASISGKLSVNNASEGDLKAAFETAGIPNAGLWAAEVDEYRPYPQDDTDFTKLRNELSKYNPGPGVLDKIVALLELP